MESYDVAVIGLGALGSAAAYHAALRGAKVIGLEQYEFGHVKGASHDTSRIFRTSNPLPEQVALSRSALQDWRKLEALSGQQLLTKTGGLVFFPRNVPIAQTLDDFTKSLDAESMPYELLSAKAVTDRWPQFNLPPDVDAVYSNDTGILHAAKSVTAMQFVARFHGAILRENTTVKSVTPSKNDDGYLLTTSKGQLRAAKVILATDAWSNALLKPLGAEIPLTVMQEQVTYFQPDPEVTSGFAPENFPVWIWFGEKAFYGFPTYGEPTIKVAQDASGNYMDPATRTFKPSPKLLSELNKFTGTLIPTKGSPSRTITCQYTITPERQLIMSPLESHPGIILGLGAALGFKYAPAIGRVLAELAIDGKTSEEIANFKIPRSVQSSRL